MTFIHEDSEFPELLAIVQRQLADQGVALSEALVEKDYWVTHTLWSLHYLGLEVWFKGGTSLSKGFGLIQRFSEDLDLKIEGGRYELPKVANWKSVKPGRIAERRAFFEAIAGLAIPGLRLRLDPESMDERCQGAEIQAIYPGIHLAALEHSMKPFVLLEVGEARVRPFLDRPLSSFVHDYLQGIGRLNDYVDNRPASEGLVERLNRSIASATASSGARGMMLRGVTTTHSIGSAPSIVSSTIRFPITLWR